MDPERCGTFGSIILRDDKNYLDYITLLYLFIIRIFAKFLQPVCTTTGGKVYTDLKFHFHLSSWADDTVKSSLVFSRLWSKGRPH